ncbi:hypothetical protein [Thioalkalivibrio sp. ALgr3]|uniref:hypothetical protein n=1 Tax=Thioalkalivibrio sp. ALgr3 TaxID=1239292 RepID=UPI00036A3351|nr:hypothetical protein [Thioalkalivibrio sp. ALgr3]
MIRFVTDQWLNEPDILSPVRHLELSIVDLDGNLVSQSLPPEKGWTHEELEAYAEELAPLTEGGADAYLGRVWVGGTEV